MPDPPLGRIEKGLQMFEGCIFGVPDSNYRRPNHTVPDKAKARTGMEIGKQARGIDGGTAPTYVSYRAAPLIEIL